MNNSEKIKRPFRSNPMPKTAKRKTVKILPVKAWAEISRDVPPSIWSVAYWREHLRQDLRHIRVEIRPLSPKPKPAKKRSRK